MPTETATPPDMPDVAAATPTSAAAVLGPVRRARQITRHRYAMMLAGLVMTLLLAVMMRTLLGDFTITFGDFIRIIFGADMPGARYILLESTLPRAVLGALVGLAFGIGGSIFQTTLRNPLASPDILGVSLGASTAAVFAIVILGQQGVLVSVAAIVGALVTAAIVRWQAGSHQPAKLILAGIGMTAALQSAVHYLFTRADEYDASAVLHWLSGSLNGADWTTIAALAVALAVLCPGVMALSRTTVINELGTDTATGLGVPPRHTPTLQVIAVTLVALGVAAAGPVAFVAFLSGPIARYLNAGRTTLLGAAVTGAVIVVTADYLGAYLIADISLPVGVITGVLGAPCLLWLLATGRASGRTT